MIIDFPMRQDVERRLKDLSDHRPVDSGHQILVDFARLVIAELTEPTPDHEKLFWILQHGRTCRLIRSTGVASFSKYMTRDPNGQPWEFDLTELGQKCVESARKDFKGHLPPQ